jgi:hypothetical protein
MMASKNHVRLELETDELFSRKNAIAERIVWVLLALFVLAGFIGFFGKGGISRTQQESGDGALLIDYDRYLRYNTDTELKLSLLKAPPTDSLKLIVSDGFIDKVMVGSITPEPIESGLTPQGQLFVFRHRPGNFIPVITFHFKPEHDGTLRSTITMPGREPLSISQFVYP